MWLKYNHCKHDDILLENSVWTLVEYMTTGFLLTNFIYYSFVIPSLLYILTSGGSV